MSLVFIIFSLFLQSQAALADRCPGDLDPNSTTFVANLFHEDYSKHGSIYLPRQCGKNVKELLLDLRDRHVDIHNTEVLFLLNEYQRFAGGPIFPDSIRPAHSRQNIQKWDFHVVLRYNDPAEHQAYILDLDGPAQPTPIHEYFRYMFPSLKPGEDRLKNITVRAIETEKYLHAFEVYYQTRDQRKTLDDNYVVGDFKNADPKIYPTMSLKEYLDRTVPKVTPLH